MTPTRMRPLAEGWDKAFSQGWQSWRAMKSILPTTEPARGGIARDAISGISHSQWLTENGGRTMSLGNTILPSTFSQEVGEDIRSCKGIEWPCVERQFLECNWSILWRFKKGPDIFIFMLMPSTTTGLNLNLVGKEPSVRWRLLRVSPKTFKELPSLAVRSLVIPRMGTTS